MRTNVWVRCVFMHVCMKRRNENKRMSASCIHSFMYKQLGMRTNVCERRVTARLWHHSKQIMVLPRLPSTLQSLECHTSRQAWASHQSAASEASCQHQLYQQSKRVCAQLIEWEPWSQHSWTAWSSQPANHHTQSQSKMPSNNRTPLGWS